MPAPENIRISIGDQLIMARKKIIAGNWKMNMTPSEAVALVETLKPLVATEDADVVFCVPAIDIIPVVEAVKGSQHPGWR